MRKITAAICAAALTVTMSISALAAPSIGQLIPIAPEVVSGTVEDGAEVVVQNVTTEEYESQEVKGIVEDFNDDEKIVTVEEVLNAMMLLEANDKFVDAETGETVYKTNKDNDIDPLEYEALMPFVDLVLKKDQVLSYTSEGELIVKIRAEVAKDLEQDDLVILLIDPATGEIHFIEVEEYDPETGDITAAFPCLGPFTILTKGELPADFETYSWVNETEVATEA